MRGSFVGDLRWKHSPSVSILTSLWLRYHKVKSLCCPRPDMTSPPPISQYHCGFVWVSEDVEDIYLDHFMSFILGVFHASLCRLWNSVESPDAHFGNQSCRSSLLGLHVMNNNYANTPGASCKIVFTGLNLSHSSVLHECSMSDPYILI